MLAAKTNEFRQRLKEKLADVPAEQRDEAERAALEELLPEAFAVVREAGKRTLRMRHFDVQLIGGMVLHDGQIAEMKTGEGKTLVATLPAYLNALTGRGVHVVTVNDYLARRDAEWMGQVHRFLGLSVGLIQQDMDPATRRLNYGCDITYATNSELGFDYLRDNMANDIAEVVQRDPYFCVIDEVTGDRVPVFQYKRYMESRLNWEMEPDTDKPIPIFKTGKVPPGFPRLNRKPDKLEPDTVKGVNQCLDILKFRLSTPQQEWYHRCLDELSFGVKLENGKR